jgi:hypothetical protein
MRRFANKHLSRGQGDEFTDAFVEGGIGAEAQDARHLGRV